MFDQIFIEKHIAEHPRTKSILAKLKRDDFKTIDKIEGIFGRVKKPYLQKRETLNLFLGEKRGERVKIAPDAYGIAGEPHYYFVHAYNCIYECDYCYLQGYFHSPDIVLFINHEDILADMKKILEETPNSQVWFHAGEFSDSLALSHLTGELEIYHRFCKENPRAIIELRTKSVNFRKLKELESLPNFILSMSLTSQSQIKEHDLKTPPYKTRIKALKEISGLGHPLGLHLDPIVYEDDFARSYEQLFVDLVENIQINDIQYISLGVVRFPKESYRDVKINYPKSKLHVQEFITGIDGKLRYPRPLRLHILNTIKQIGIRNSIPEDKFYLCMED